MNQMNFYAQIINVFRSLGFAMESLIAPMMRKIVVKLRSIYFNIDLIRFCSVNFPIQHFQIVRMVMMDRVIVFRSRKMFVQHLNAQSMQVVVS